VAKIIEHSADVKTFWLEANADKGTKALAWFSAGQYLSISLEVGPVKMTRPYSLSSSPREALKGHYSLTIKRVEGGLASNFILDNWTVGTEVTASEPLGVFTYEPLRDAKTVIGIAGGSGITPFRSLAKAIADGDEDATLILLYGSRTMADAVFQEEFKALEGEKFKLVNVLSHEEAEGCEKGFITAELIKKYAPEGDYSIFLCGPQAMYNFVDKEIETLGLRKKFIRHELFGEYFNPAKEADYPADVAPEFKITVRIAGNEQTINAPADTSILRSLEAAGIAAPAHCRSGECGWCHSKLVSGEVYCPKSVDGRREADYIYGYIHPCCSFPLSDLVIEVPPVRK
jgi:ferredoxin-NADP reductase